MIDLQALPAGPRAAAVRLSRGRATRVDRYWVEPERVMRDAGIDPDPWQSELLRYTGRNVLLNAARQSGKSTVVAALALLVAMVESPALVLLLSRSLRQARELFQAKVLPLYRAMRKPVAVQRETKLQLELENGSRIISLPGHEETIRGFSGVSLLVLDEASRIPDDLFKSVRPMLAVSKGRIVGLSTPWGERGWWYTQYKDKHAPWKRFEIPAMKCPRISKEFLDEELRMHGSSWVDQEYRCQFSNNVDAAFAKAVIDAAVSEGLDALEL